MQLVDALSEANRPVSQSTQLVIPSFSVYRPGSHSTHVSFHSPDALARPRSHETHVPEDLKTPAVSFELTHISPTSHDGTHSDMFVSYRSDLSLHSHTTPFKLMWKSADVAARQVTREYVSMRSRVPCLYPPPYAQHASRMEKSPAPSTFKYLAVHMLFPHQSPKLLYELQFYEVVPCESVAVTLH